MSQMSDDRALTNDILEQVGLRVVGQHAMVERLLIALLTGGHVLLEGVPGLAKTLTVRTLAETVRTSFSRIQFTPDLLPADVIGTQVFDQATATFSVRLGAAGVVLRSQDWPHQLGNSLVRPGGPVEPALGYPTSAMDTYEP